MIALFILYFMVRNIIAAGSEEDCVSSYNCFNNFDCTNNGTTNCISDYSSLESYVKNDKAIVDKLTKTFYRTGHSPARFVRITYKFQIPAHNNDSENKNESSCIPTERLYYWSESPVYLLGPRPLYYCHFLLLTWKKMMFLLSSLVFKQMIKKHCSLG